jgi:hypothetical protein
MYEYVTLQERTHERHERLTHEAAAHRLAREARGRRHERRQRRAWSAAYELLVGARRAAQRYQTGA